MANHSSTKKSIRKTLRRTAVNKNRNSFVKTCVKKFLTSLSGDTNIEAMRSLFVKAQSELARASSKGVIKARRASRLTSRLNTKLKKAAGGSSITAKN